MDIYATAFYGFPNVCKHMVFRGIDFFKEFNILLWFHVLFKGIFFWRDELRKLYKRKYLTSFVVWIVQIAYILHFLLYFMILFLLGFGKVVECFKWNGDYLNLMIIETFTLRWFIIGVFIWMNKQRCNNSGRKIMNNDIQCS